MAENRSVPSNIADINATELVEGAGYWTLVWRQFRKNRLAFASGVVIVLLFLLAAWAPLLAHGKPLIWTETRLDPRTGQYSAETSYPLIRYLVAPSDQMNVDYLFNYFFFISITLLCSGMLTWLRCRGKRMSRSALRSRALWAGAVAVLVALLPFIEPGVRLRSATPEERKADLEMQRALTALDEERERKRLTPEAYEMRKHELTTLSEWRPLRPWRLDDRDYFRDFLVSQDTDDPERRIRALFPPFPHDPNLDSHEVLQPPGLYARLKNHNYRMVGEEALHEEISAGISRVCMPGGYVECREGAVVLARHQGAARITAPTDGLKRSFGALKSNTGIWLFGRLKSRQVSDELSLRLLEKLEQEARTEEALCAEFKLEPEQLASVLADVSAKGQIEKKGFCWARRKGIQAKWDLEVEDVRARSEPLETYRHWLGTDRQGRDVLARIFHGARISISVGFVSVTICVLIGILIGGLAGYFRGWVDMVISRFIELVICFPSFFLILTILALVENRSIFHVMLIIGVTGWTGVARLIRGEFLKLAGQDFVHAARALGCSSARVMFRHVLPNALGPVLVAAAFGVAGAVLTESGLSYLGFGAPPPTPTWGEMIKQGKENIQIAWWLLLFPGFLIFLTVTVYNLAGDGMRDAMDPRMRT